VIFRNTFLFYHHTPSLKPVKLPENKKNKFVISLSVFFYDIASLGNNIYNRYSEKWLPRKSHQVP